MITILGAGGFGKALSKILGKQKHFLVDIESDGSYSEKSIEILKNTDNLIICVPSQALISCLDMIKNYVNKKAILLFCTKGLYEGIKTPTEISNKYLSNPVAALTGPNLSAEIMIDVPTMTGIAGSHADEWIKLFTTVTFKPIKEHNAAAIEFGGAVKNIIALGAGLLDGYFDGKGCNAMGSFIAFALKDIEHIYHHKHDNPLNHLSFIGDLFTTCMSESSRNHEYGHKFGSELRKGKKLDKPEKTVEGYRTLQIIFDYAVKHKMKLPTLTALYNVFFADGKIKDIVDCWK